MKRLLLIGFLAAFVFAAGASLSHFSAPTTTNSVTISSISAAVTEPGTDP